MHTIIYQLTISPPTCHKCSLQPYTFPVENKLKYPKPSKIYGFSLLFFASIFFPFRQAKNKLVAIGQLENIVCMTLVIFFKIILVRQEE